MFPMSEIDIKIFNKNGISFLSKKILEIRNLRYNALEHRLILESVEIESSLQNIKTIQQNIF